MKPFAFTENLFGDPPQLGGIRDTIHNLLENALLSLRHGGFALGCSGGILVCTTERCALSLVLPSVARSSHRS
jgi:hypothetical protein